MKSKKEIIDIIIEKFDRVYCCTCEHKSDETYCDWCDKQNTLWAVSNEYAEVIANKILEG